MANQDPHDPVGAATDLDPSKAAPASASPDPGDDPATRELLERMKTLHENFLEGAERVKAAHEEFMSTLQTIMAQAEGEAREAAPTKADSEE